MDNFILTGENLSMTFDGKSYTFPVPKNSQKILSLLLKKEFQKVINLLSPKDNISHKTKGMIKIVKKDDRYQMLLNDQQVPVNIKRRIDELIRLNEPLDPILNFWEKLKENPSQKSQNHLLDFLQHNDIKIAENGSVIGYKGVDKDLKDCHTHTYDNSPGQEPEMDRAKVDPDDSHHCSTGFHIGAYSYARGFGPRMVECEINPKNVVTVPPDCNGEKMRVCKYRVLREVTGKTIEQVNAEPFIFMENEKFEEKDSIVEKPKKASKTFKQEDNFLEFDATRISKDRLLIPKKAIILLGKITKVGIYSDGITILITKVNKKDHYDAEMKIDSSCNIRLPKSILDAVSPKREWHLVCSPSKIVVS